MDFLQTPSKIQWKFSIQCEWVDWITFSMNLPQRSENNYWFITVANVVNRNKAKLNSSQIENLTTVRRSLNFLGRLRQRFIKFKKKLGYTFETKLIRMLIGNIQQCDIEVLFQDRKFPIAVKPPHLCSALRMNCWDIIVQSKIKRLVRYPFVVSSKLNHLYLIAEEESVDSAWTNFNFALW